MLENGDRLVAIDTLTNKVIGSSPIGQGGQAMAYVPNAVPEGNGTQGLQPLGIAGNATHLSLVAMVQISKMISARLMMAYCLTEIVSSITVIINYYH
ncbi:MAG: hypothetical protein WAM42_16880 [Candidatus Nitrosopolaris sp.]